MKLLVISDAPILLKNGKQEAYAPYVTEMDLWMQHVTDTTFLCPTSYNRPLLTKPFAKQQFNIISVSRLEFHTVVSILKSACAIPVQFFTLFFAMRRANHIHMRAPGNLVLLASFVAILLPRKRKTIKYAGNFNPTASQPLSYKLQKWVFSNTALSKNTTVMAYGDWPDSSKNVEAFFTATYNEKQRGSFEKNLALPLQFMFVGTLSPNKNPQLLIELVSALHKKGIPAQAHFYGDGPMMDALQVMGSALEEASYELGVQSSEFEVETSSALGETSSESDGAPLKSSFTSGRLGWDKTSSELSKRQSLSGNKQFIFYGNQPAAVVKKAYETSHFLFLASQSEGWPKVVAEAMWHGCIPVATPVSCVPWMLGVTSYELGVQSSEYNETSSKFEELTDGAPLKSAFPSGRLGWVETSSELDESSYELGVQSSEYNETSSKFEELTDGAPLKSAFPSGRLGWEEASLPFIGSRGVIYNNMPQAIHAMEYLLANPSQFLKMSRASQAWSQKYTLERFEAAIIKLLRS